MIRPFSKSDLPALIHLEALTQFSPWSGAIFEQCFKAGCQGWVIDQNHTVIGFVMINLQVGECHILNICIHPEYQGQGLGHELLVHTLKKMKAKGAKIAYLEVRRTNKQAIALYEKLEFVEIAVRKNYYSTNQGREDAIVLGKDLGVDDTL